MFKTTKITSTASMSPSLFSRIKAKFARVRVGRSAKVVADVVFVPETVSSAKALILETSEPIAASENIEAAAKPLSNTAGHTDASVTMDSESPMLPSILAPSSYRSAAVNEDEAVTILKANEPYGTDGVEMATIPSSCTALLAAGKITLSMSMSTSTSIDEVCTFLDSLPTSCTGLLGETEIPHSSSVPVDYATFVASLPSFWRALDAADDAAPSGPVSNAMSSLLTSLPSSWTALLADDEVAVTSSSMSESRSMPRMTTCFSWSDIRTEEELWISTAPVTSTSNELGYSIPALIVTSPSTDTIIDDVQVADLFHGLLAIHTTVPPTTTSTPVFGSLVSLETIPDELDEAEATLVPLSSSANDLFARLKKAIDGNHISDYNTLLDSLIF